MQISIELGKVIKLSSICLNQKIGVKQKIGLKQNWMKKPKLVQENPVISIEIKKNK